MSDYKKVKDENPNFKCRYCGSGELEYRMSDSDYDDIRYSCPDCGKSWWVEGSDY